jgi:protein O-mannosyl-transferase
MAIKKKVETTRKMSAPVSERSFHRKIVAFFFLLCFLLYGKGIGNDYSMDDEFVVRNNAQVQRGIKAIPEIFKTTYVIDSQKSSYEYRPIVKAVYALECQVFGANPHVSHFINILLYAIAVSFLYFMLIRLFPQYNYIFPFIVTTLFLIHPLHSEVVYSIKNRDVILSFTGCLLSLYFYLRFYEAQTKKYHFLLFGAFFMLFAMMSKKDSMTFYAIIPFTLWFLKDIPFKRLGYVFLSYLLPMIVFRIANKGVINIVSRKVLEWENPLFIKTTILERIPTGFYSIYFYVKMYLIPYPLISYYGYNQVPIAKWTSPVVWIVIAALIAVGYFIVKNLKKDKAIVYGILYFLITISMFTNVLKPVVGIVGERFAFIPSVGLSIVSGWGLFKLLQVSFENKEMKWPAFSSRFFLVFGAVALIFSGITFTRHKAWKDAYTLYKTDVANAPESAHANTLFAAACIQKVKENPKMKVEEKRVYVANALKHYEKSLEIIPKYLTSLNNLGMIYYTYYNEPEKAIPYLKKAVSLDSTYVEAHFNLATCEAKTNRKKEAEIHYLRSLELDPEFINTYYSLSNMYAEDKEYEKIYKLNKEGIDKGVRSDVLYINVGNYYFIKGDTASGVPYLEKGIELNPDNRFLNSFLANYYKNKGDLDKANYYYDLVGSSKKGK